MKFSIIIVTKDNREFKIEDSVTSIKYSQTIKSQAGKCVLTVDNLTEEIPLGSQLVLTVEGVGMFKGYLFSESYNQDMTSNLTFYDQLRYWQGTDVMSVKNTSLSEFFVRVCKTLNLKYSLVNPTTRKLPYKIFDNQTYFSMWQKLQSESLAIAGDLHIFRDEFGSLVFRNVQSNFNHMKEKILISDLSASNGFDFERSIDSDTYNYVKLINENSKTKKRETHIIYDTKSISNWGRLAYLEKSSEEVNSSALKKRAEDILKSKNRITKTLNMSIEGSLKTLNLKAGDGVVTGITAMARSNMFGRAFVVESLTHNFNGGNYTIDLDLMLE